MNKYLKIHSIDLKKDKCEKCGREIYPSIFCSVKPKWKYSYVCKKCIVKSGVIDMKQLEEYVKNYLNSYETFNYIDSSWLNDTNKKEILEEFLKIEKEDSKYIKSPDLWKAHIFKEELDKGRVIYSEQEMFEYMNFYYNNPEIVLSLRKMFFENPQSRFLKGLYYASRTCKLSNKQIQALKRNKNFPFKTKDIEDFWEYIPLILQVIENQDIPSEESLKIKNIVESVINEQFFTEKQRYTIDKFIHERILGNINEERSI